MTKRENLQVMLAKLDIVRELRQFGYDVLTDIEPRQANQAIPDEDVLTFATQTSRVVITLNRDDFIILFGRFGVVGFIF